MCFSYFAENCIDIFVFILFCWIVSFERQFSQSCFITRWLLTTFRFLKKVEQKNTWRRDFVLSQNNINKLKIFYSKKYMFMKYSILKRNLTLMKTFFEIALTIYKACWSWQKHSLKFRRHDLMRLWWSWITSSTLLSDKQQKNEKRKKAFFNFCFLLTKLQLLNRLLFFLAHDQFYVLRNSRSLFFFAISTIF